MLALLLVITRGHTIMYMLQDNRMKLERQRESDIKGYHAYYHSYSNTFRRPEEYGISQERYSELRDIERSDYKRPSCPSNWTNYDEVFDYCNKDVFKRGWCFEALTLSVEDNHLMFGRIDIPHCMAVNFDRYDELIAVIPNMTGMVDYRNIFTKVQNTATNCPAALPETCKDVTKPKGCTRCQLMLVDTSNANKAKPAINVIFHKLYPRYSDTGDNTLITFNNAIAKGASNLFVGNQLPYLSPKWNITNNDEGFDIAMKAIETSVMAAYGHTPTSYANRRVGINVRRPSTTEQPTCRCDTSERERKLSDELYDLRYKETVYLVVMFVMATTAVFSGILTCACCIKNNALEAQLQNSIALYQQLLLDPAYQHLTSPTTINQIFRRHREQ